MAKKKKADTSAEKKPAVKTSGRRSRVRDELLKEREAWYRTYWRYCQRKSGKRLRQDRTTMTEIDEFIAQELGLAVRTARGIRRCQWNLGPEPMKRLCEKLDELGILSFHPPEVLGPDANGAPKVKAKKRMAKKKATRSKKKTTVKKGTARKKATRSKKKTVTKRTAKKKSSTPRKKGKKNA